MGPLVVRKPDQGNEESVDDESVNVAELESSLAEKET
jgi:hypothetical protein